jgi:hypothetical protein
MRRDWRNVLMLVILFQGGTSAAAAPQEAPREGAGTGADVVRLTVELSWGTPQKGLDPAEETARGQGVGPKREYVLELTEGRVVEAMEWPPRGLAGAARQVAPTSVAATGPGPKGSWRLGSAPEGRIRARLEAPLDASVVLRRADHLVNIPVAAVLERPQHTPQQAPLVVNVERLAWDSLSVEMGDSGADGILAPGTEVPLSIGFNILWPDCPEVSVRTTAVLRPARGGDVVWRSEQSSVVPTNSRQPVAQSWSLKAPRVEGSYVLEIRATWEPTGVRDGSRLSRLIRRRKPAAVPTSTVRRLALTVIDPKARPVATAGAREGHGRETEVDTIDLARLRGYRLLASGRSPMVETGRPTWAIPSVALIEPSRRDKLRGWISRSGAEAAKLDPGDATGLTWSAVGLKVAHPDRPHRLTLKVKGGEPAALGVALVEPGGTDAANPPRLVLDACASGPPIPQDGAPAAFNWLVWPNSSEMVLVLVNRSPDATVRLGTVTLTELDDVPSAPVLVGPRTPDGRTLGLYLSGPNPLGPYGDEADSHDAWTTAGNLAKYLGYCGASAVVLPEALADRSIRRGLQGQADEDATRPDRLETIRRVLRRQGFSLWLELDFGGTEALPGLPPADSAEAERRGLVRLDRQGRVDGPAYHPLHPEVREAMKRRVVAAVTRTGAVAAGNDSGSRTLDGVVIRLGPGPTLLGTPDTGLDDATFERFVHETFNPETANVIPGLGNTDPDRFAVRSRYLAGVGRMPWLTWRSRAIAALYAELADAVRTAAPGAELAVVTPGLDGGPAGTEARRVDRAGLVPSQAWRSVGLDLQAWPSAAGEPLVLRGATLSADALAHDLATSPDLDGLVAARAHRGLLLGIDADLPPREAPGGTGRNVETPDRNTDAGGKSLWLSALPLGEGPAADEPLGHALAALDSRWIFVAGKAISGHEERLRRFAVVFRALPAWPSTAIGTQGESNPKPFGVAVRSMSDGTQTFLEIANDSPYPVRLASVLDAPATAAVDDLGRGLRLAPMPAPGGRQLVLDLLPFGVAAIRIAAPRVQVSSVTPYPSESVLTSIQARFEELTSQLSRLNRGLSAVAAEPTNASFEVEPLPDLGPGPPIQASQPVAKAGLEQPASPGSSTIPGGWRIEGNPRGPAANAIAIDHENPHSGQGSLRLSTSSAPASVVSEPFAPNAQSSLMIQTYFRASVNDTKVRLWIEGEAGGQPYIRRTELSVSTGWEARMVRASDVPPGGLDAARLRFELLGPGTLWIDDIRILASDTDSKSARLHAQRTLLAALQAYREHRYADFARLAGSHWVRQSNAMATGRLARTNEVPPSASNAAVRSTDAEASALPSDRKLR